MIDVADLYDQAERLAERAATFDEERWVIQVSIKGRTLTGKLRWTWYEAVHICIGLLERGWPNATVVDALETDYIPF